MKKIFSQSALIILSAVMVVCISACASKKGVQPKGEEPKVAEKAVEKEPKAPAVEEPAEATAAYSVLIVNSFFSNIVDAPLC